jgi:hypothetical protein
MVFSQKKVYYAFIAQEMQKKTHFLIGFSTKNCKLLNVLNLVNVH